MKIKIVRQNLLQKFQEKFDTLFNDPEFTFRGDDKLVSHICSSLQFDSIDSFDDSDGMLPIGVISQGITLV